MPRPQKLRKWKEHDMIDAYTSVKNGNMSIKAAAKYYNVPRMTLSDRVNGKVKIQAKMGVQTVLNEEEENALVHYIDYMANRGFPLSIQQICGFAWCIGKERGKGDVFSRNGPSKKWWRGFKLRHPKKFTLRTPDALDRGRAAMGNVYVMREYFEMLKNTMESNALMDKPQCVYNCDEAALYLNKSAGQKVVVPVRFKHAHSVSIATNEHISVHCSANAAGIAIPPMIIFSKCFPGGPYHRQGPINASYAFSDSGFMDQAIYLQWFEKTFLEHAVKQRPLLLLQDGASSHISVPLIEKAIQNDVILLCLPPHTTHITQPLDVAVYRKMKTEAAKIMNQAKMVKSDLWVSKRNVSAVFKIIFERSFTMACITEGFRKCGIYPFDPNAIDKSLLLRSNTEIDPASIDLSVKPRENQSSFPSATANEDTNVPATGAENRTVAAACNDVSVPETLPIVTVGNDTTSVPEKLPIVTVGNDTTSISEKLPIVTVGNDTTNVPVTIVENIALPSIANGTIYDMNGIDDPFSAENFLNVSVDSDRFLRWQDAEQIIPDSEDFSTDDSVVSSCPPDLALAAIECGLTPRKKRKYDQCFKCKMTIKCDPVFQTWKSLKQQIDDVTIPTTTLETHPTHEPFESAHEKVTAVEPDNDVKRHPLVRAGLIPDDLVDILVTPKACETKRRSGKKETKARVLTSMEVQEELKEKERKRLEEERAKEKRKLDRLMKKKQKEEEMAKKNEERNKKKEAREQLTQQREMLRQERQKLKLSKMASTLIPENNPEDKHGISVESQ